MFIILRQIELVGLQRADAVGPFADESAARRWFEAFGMEGEQVMFIRMQDAYSAA